LVWKTIGFRLAERLLCQDLKEPQNRETGLSAETFHITVPLEHAKMTGADSGALGTMNEAADHLEAEVEFLQTSPKYNTERNIK
jgi:hypothetical protein